MAHPPEAEPQSKPASKLAFLLYFGANLAPRFAMLASMLVLTRVLPVAEYGLFVLVVTTGEFLESTTTTWVRLLLMRTEAGRGSPRPRALRRARTLTVGALLISAVAVVPIGLALEWGRAAAFAFATIAYVASFSLLRFLLTLFLIGERHAAYNRTEALRALSIFAATVIGPLIDHQSFLPTSLTMSAGAASVAVWGLARAPSARIGSKVRRLRLKPALSFGAPIILLFGVTFALRSASQYALEAVIGLGAVAIYSAAASLARQPIELVTGALNNFTYPLLLRRQATGGYSGVAEAQTGVLLTVTALGAGIVALTSVLSAPIASLFLPEVYRSAAAEIMPWVSFGTFCFALKQFVFENCFHVTKRNWIQLASTVLPALIGVAVTIWFVAAFGLRGAAPGFAVVSVLSLLSSAFASRWVLAFPVPLLRIGAVAVSAAIASGVTWAAGPLLSRGGLLVLLISSTVLFTAVYATALACAGFSIKRLLAAPWDPLRPGREERAPDAADLTPHEARPL